MKTAQLLLLVCCVFLAACRKDPCPAPGLVAREPCVPLPAPPSLGDWNYRYDPHWIKDARFNPFDANEILFTHAPYGGTVRQVFRFNLQTHAKSLIYEGAVIFPSEWGNDGWVVVNVHPGFIFKVKANGDSLTQLTFTAGCYAPIMDGPRERIGFSTSMQRSEVIDMAGNYLDTIPYQCGFIVPSVWLTQNEVAAINCYGVQLSDLVDCAREVLAPLPPNSSGCGAGITYSNETTLLWSDSQGIFTTDVNTRVTKRVLSTCNSSFYLGLSHDPVTDRVVTVRIDKEPDGFDLLIHSTLVIMRSDGTDFHEIPIPW